MRPSKAFSLAATRSRRIGITGAVVNSALFFSGCLAGPDSTGQPNLDSSLVLGRSATTWTYSCPSGRGLTSSDGVCSDALGEVGSPTGNPILALHPANNRIIAIATSGAPDPWAAVGHVSQGFLHFAEATIWFTEDAGATWARVLPPRPPPHPAWGPIQIGDVRFPGIVFDANGTLHYRANVHYNAPVQDLLEHPASDVFYASTSDLGRSWTAPVVLTSDVEDSDGWNSAGSLSVVGPDLYSAWQRWSLDSEKPALTRLARSHDAGATWDLMPDPLLDCVNPSQAVLFNASVHVACRVESDGNDARNVRVYRLNSSADEFELVVELSNMRGYAPALLALHDNGLMLAVSDDVTVLATRTSQGTNWTEPVDLRASTTLEGNGRWVEFGGPVLDPTGFVHVVLSADYEGTESGYDPVVHLVLAPLELALAWEKQLTPREPDEIPRIPRFPSPFLLELFDLDGPFPPQSGIAIGPEFGLVAWEFEGDIQISRLEQGAQPS